MSEYIRHLIILDMRGLIGPKKQSTEVCHQEIAVESSNPKAKIKPFMMQSYGKYRDDLMDELKDVISSRRFDES